ncbi:acyl-CoA thioesterase [Isoalcanivorax beigongshangi]|uniref:Acyl-CoA thioesterase n=1 Tax=Isoalcanivorax beigongshangi TaxID=3238810 RepID=A0ABV4AG17_9GAMM
MKDIVRDLLEVIALERLEQNLFRGPSRNTHQRGIFGGLVAGQALMAASRTVDDDRLAHSLHGYFLRPGDHTVPVIYDVDRIRDGASFTTRRVTAIQHGRAIFCLEASFQVAERGMEHQAPMPEAPAAGSLQSEQELREVWRDRFPIGKVDAFMQERPVEIRPVRQDDPFDFNAKPAHRAFWFRVPGEFDVDAAMHRALLAYCSDCWLLGTSALPHGVNYFSPGVMMASIDHAMWFHRPFKVNEWLLYDMYSPSASGARGLSRGSIYTADGQLVASVMQEGLVRVSELGD